MSFTYKDKFINKTYDDLFIQECERCCSGHLCNNSTLYELPDNLTPHDKISPEHALNIYVAASILLEPKKQKKKQN